MIAFSTAVRAVPIDTVVKHICLYMQKINDPAYFTFNGDGHQFDVSFDAPPGMVIEPQSPIRTAGQTFYLSTNTEGTYDLKVSYNCVDPNCHETNYGYVRIRVENCDRIIPRACVIRDSLDAMAPDIASIGIVGFPHLDPVTGVTGTGTQLIASTSSEVSVIPDFISDVFSPTPTPTPIITDGPSTPNPYGMDGAEDYEPPIIVHKKSDPSLQYPDRTIYIYQSGDIRDEKGNLIGNLPINLFLSGSLKIDGDDLYAINSSTAYVSRDGAMTWQLDTTGIGTSYINDLALDRTQNVYLATSQGIMGQTPKGSTWNPVTSFPKTFVYKIFASRKDVLYASTNSGIWTSADEGVTWTRDSMGFGPASVDNFCDDAYGNVYAIRDDISVTTLYKQSVGSNSWTNIQSGLAGFIADPNETHVLKSITGDSNLYVASTFGIFASRDQGVTWQPHNGTLQPTTCYGLAHEPHGSYYLSTNQGIFRGQPDGPDWKKLFPSSGYLNGSPIFRDNSGTLYGRGKKDSHNAMMPTKSTDGGVSWAEDTVGTPGMPQFIYYVDEAGTQYMGSMVVPVQIFSKRAGQPWKEDDAGIPTATFGQVNIFQSDGQGNILLATSINGAGGIWKRPLAGGTWVADSAGLNGRIVFVLARDKNGSLYGGTYQAGVIVQQGGVWQDVTPPTGVDKSYSAFALSVDSSNTLVAAYGYFGLGYQYHTADVFYRPSISGAWSAMKMKADLCTAMMSVDDTTYLITSGGLMEYHSFTSSAVEESQRTLFPNPISVQPNPASSLATVSFASPTAEQFAMTVSNLLGETVCRKSGYCLDGEHQSIPLDLKDCLDGIYYIRVEVGDAVQTTKLVITR